MKPHKTIVVLLALLLAAMAMVPIVSAEDDMAGTTVVPEVSDVAVSSDDMISSNYVPVETAREHALTKMMEFTKQGLMDDKWNGATVNPDPVVIYDLNGKKLFYQFAAEKDGKKTGEILTSASKVLGVPVQLISDPNTFDPTAIQITVKDLAGKDFDGFTVQSTKIVCYSYPKMGVMVRLVNVQTLEQKDEIYDANYLTIIPQKMPTRDGESGSWSYYQQIPENTYEERITRWNTANNRMNDIKNKALSAGIDISNDLSGTSLQSLDQIVLVSTDGVFEYGELPSGFPTIDQGQAQWCQVATAWVITKFYYPSNTRTLANIAATMQIPDIYTGADWDDELAYYTSDYLSGASNGGLGMDDSYYRTTNPSLTYEKVRSEIDEYERPLKVGYNGHSRACIGYSRNPDGDTYYKFSNSQGGVIQWEAAPNLYGSVTGYNDYIIVE
ncbi:MAG: hypothetical protein WC379_06330 [Methanoregula sp.]|jgi:hypothetical protein